MLENIRLVLLNTFKHHKYMVDVENLYGKDLNVNTFKKYIDTELNKHLDEYDIKDGLNFLSEVLWRHKSTGKSS